MNSRKCFESNALILQKDIKNRLTAVKKGKGISCFLPSVAIQVGQVEEKHIRACSH